MSIRRNPDQVAASTLLCDRVDAVGGDSIGLVYDLLIGQATGALQYVVASLGTILEAGESLRGIPWKSVEVDWDSHSLNVSTPGNDLSESSWLKVKLRSPESSPRGAFELTGNAQNILEPEKMLRLQSILGAKVENSLDEYLGKVEELVIDLRQGQVAYVVLSHGGVLGIGSKLFAIPWKALSSHPEDPTFVFNIAQEVLDQAPGFNADEWSSIPAVSKWRLRSITHHGFQRSSI